MIVLDFVCACLVYSLFTDSSMVVEKLPHSINIQDIVTKLVLLYSVYDVPLYVVTFTLLEPVPTKLAYFSMLFIAT